LQQPTREQEGSIERLAQPEAKVLADWRWLRNKRWLQGKRQQHNKMDKREAAQES
jgi:hypothetical protein